MAEGSIFVFNQFIEDMGNKVHNLSSDTLKIAFIDSVLTPSIDEVLPAWGASSTADYDGNEVTGTSGNYTAGGNTLASVTWTVNHTDDHTLLDSADISIAVDAGNPTNARWAIVYNETATNNEAICFVELKATDIDMTAGAFSYTVPATGWTRVGAGTLS